MHRRIETQSLAFGIHAVPLAGDGISLKENGPHRVPEKFSSWPFLLAL
jgi:hypothetical protein